MFINRLAKHLGRGLSILVLCGCGPAEPAGNSTGNSNQQNNNQHSGSDATIWWDGTPGDAGPSICEEEDFPLEQGPPPEVMLVIDKSGSMDEGSPTKWTQMVNALTAITTQFDQQIKFGLLTYPAGGGLSVQCDVPAVAVPVDLGQAASIASSLGNNPGGGTPTAFALEVAQTTLTGLGTPNPKFIILATDGGPNCNDSLTLPCSCSLGNATACCTNPMGCTALNGPSHCVDDYHCFDVLDALHQAGIDTFVLGLPGTGEYAAILDEMALRGGQPLQGGNTQYYDVTNQTELEQALQSIAGSVISCTLHLSQAPEYPEEVLITFDGVQVPRDTTKTDGWEYDDATMTSITIYGSYCDQLQSGQVTEMKALFKCPPPA